MKPLIYLFLLLVSVNAHAQDNSDETAKSFIRQGDYSNAVLVLNKAMEKDRDNIELKKDLAFAYYLQRDFSKSIDIVKPLSETTAADVQTYQMLGMNYKAIEERKEAERMYRAALKRFPESGALYNELGEVVWSKQDFSEAIKLWQKGMQIDPNYFRQLLQCS